jgi:drug/metabolite transporter (DMT)-like permease
MAARLRPSTTALALLGVLGFSITLPATRIAVQGDLDPTILSLGRAVPAAAGGVLPLLATGAPRPQTVEWGRLAVVAAGVVIGFPLLTALALRHVDASQGAVLVGMLPAATMVASVVLHREAAPARLWLGACVGLAVTLLYVLIGGRGATVAGKLELLAAVVLAGIGYAEGAALSQRLGGPAVISWALIVALPLTLPVTAWSTAEHGLHATPHAWTAFAYVSSVSMLLAFYAWYTALARSGVARIGQLQLVQPSLTLLWSGVLLGEWPAAWTIAAAAVILAAVATLPSIGPGGTAGEANRVL